MKIEKLTKMYQSKGKAQLIFDHTYFDFKNYNSIALCGRSGSGKTTLLSLLLGFDLDYEGDYIYQGQLLKKERKQMAHHRLNHISVISQDFKLLDDRNVYDNLALPLRLMKLDKNEIDDRIKKMMNLFEMGYLIKENPLQLSGGERQRIVIARALITSPDYIFADEPTSELDELTEKKVLEIFSLFKKRGIKFLIATHSKEVAKSCEVTYHIKNYKIEEDKC